MGQVVQTNGDYTIKVAEGQNIFLDTGPGVGDVKVSGNLVVEGNTLTVSAENLNVNDNIIILNYGETGAGVSLRYSGIQVDRGTETPASIIFDENNDIWLFASGSPEGTIGFGTLSNIKLKEIHTNTDTDSGDLGFNVGNGGVLKILSSGGNYRERVLDADDIPNKEYVDESIRSNPTFQIVDDDTRVIATDVDVAGSVDYLLSETGYSTFGESAISMIVDGQMSLRVFKDFVIFQDLEFNRNEITNSNTNENIYIRTQGTGKLQVNYGIQLENLSANPAGVADHTVLYSANPSTGDSGVWFVKPNSEYGELVSKNRALLFSMLF